MESWWNVAAIGVFGLYFETHIDAHACITQSPKPPFNGGYTQKHELSAPKSLCDSPITISVGTRMAITAAAVLGSKD